MPITKYKLKEFDSRTLKEAKEQWEKIAGQEAFDVEFLSTFQWAATHMIEQPGDSIALSLEHQDTMKTHAIVEVVSSRNAQTTKLLKVVTSPEFLDTNNQRNEILSILNASFAQVIVRGWRGSMKTVKLYARDDEMMSILKSVHARWAIPDTSAEFKGRFFTVTWS